MCCILYSTKSICYRLCSDPLPKQKSLSDRDQPHDEPGILRSQGYINSLIQEEVAKGIPTNRIVIGGFSQGGAISVFTGLTCPHKLGGIFGLSSYLLLGDKIRGMVPQENPNKDTPIFLAHGDNDPVVQYAWGKKTADMLKGWGWNVDFRTYP